MKTFIFLLIISCLIQTSFLPLNLCLILLICRSLASPGKINLYLAFFSGIFLGILSSVNIGFFSLAFLIIIQIVEMFKNSRFITSNLFMILPISLASLLILCFSQELFLGQSINFMLILVSGILSLPAFFLIKFWDERFTRVAGIKLKL